MRITERVHVARGTRDVGGDVHETHTLRGLNASGFADIELRVARVLQERGEPAEFQLGAAVDQDIGVAQLHDEARPGVDEVRVFRRLRHRGHVRFVGSDLTRERAEIGQGGDDVEFGVSDRWPEEKGRQD